VDDEQFLREFTDSYIRTGLWADLYGSRYERADYPHDALNAGAEITASSRAEIEADCAGFTASAAEVLGAGRAGLDPRRCGVDFWLTRNRHGAGFGDGGYPEPAATLLTALARPYGSAAFVLASDGEITYETG
jgi:hypothetical protein